MPSWKKVIVSGSQTHLSGITSSVLTQTNLLIANAGGAIGNSGVILSGNTLALGSNSITSTGANSVLTGSFSGTFSGSLTVNLQDLTQGAGITAFTYDGNSPATVAVSGASALSTNRVTKWTGAAFADTTITDNGSIITTTTPLSVGGAITTTNITASGIISSSSTLIGAVLSTSGQAIIGGSLRVDGNTTLGDTSADTASIGAGRVNISNLPVGSSELAVLVTGSGGQVFTRAIDSRVFGTGLVDATNGADNRIATFTDGDSITGENDLTFNGTTFAVSTGFTATTAGAVNAASITTTGNVVVGGDLTVNGTTTILNVANVMVEDRFILLASGSISGSASHADGGIIVQYTTGSGGSPTGSALFLNSKVQVTPQIGQSTQTFSARWGLNNSVGHTQTTLNPTDYLVSVTRSQANPTAAPEFGGQLLGFGNMYIQNNGDIWFWSPDLTDNEGSIVYAG